ncbi:unnamed protein product, partial [Polarella glacialis]
QHLEEEAFEEQCLEEDLEETSEEQHPDNLDEQHPDEDLQELYLEQQPKLSTTAGHIMHPSQSSSSSVE